MEEHITDQQGREGRGGRRGREIVLQLLLLLLLLRPKTYRGSLSSLGGSLPDDDDMLVRPVNMRVILGIEVGSEGGVCVGFPLHVGGGCPPKRTKSEGGSSMRRGE